MPTKELGKRKADAEPEEAAPAKIGKKESGDKANAAHSVLFSPEDRKKLAVIDKSSFQNVDPTTLSEPYYKMEIHLRYEPAETNPPETYHTTSEEAAKALWQFFEGTYGYGQGSYMIYKEAWVGYEFYVRGTWNDDEPTMIGIPETAQMIDDAIAEEGVYELTNWVHNFVKITKVVGEEDDAKTSIQDVYSDTKNCEKDTSKEEQENTHQKNHGEDKEEDQKNNDPKVKNDDEQGKDGEEFEEEDVKVPSKDARDDPKPIGEDEAEEQENNDPN